MAKLDWMKKISIIHTKSNLKYECLIHLPYSKTNTFYQWCDIKLIIILEPFNREKTYNFVILSVPLNVQQGNSFNRAISISALISNVLNWTLHLKMHVKHGIFLQHLANALLSHTRKKSSDEMIWTRACYPILY